MDGKQYYEMCKGRWRDRRCFTYSWFGHLACNCRNRELVATRQTQGGENINRWEVLRSHVMRCGVKSVVHPIRGNVQQKRRYWRCGEKGHCLWACPKKATHPEKGEAQQKVVRRTEVERMTREIKCVKCRRKGMNTVYVPESVAKGKICPSCENGKGKRINTAHPKREEAQLKRSWWREKKEAQNRGWLRS